jgi:hypothetical protein
MPATQSFARRLAFVASLFAIVLLGGCATSREAYLADASPAQTIECAGVFGSWNSCRAQAQTVCGDSGYQVISRNHQDGISEEQAEKIAQAQSFHQREMLVQCGNGNVRVAGLTDKAQSQTAMAL